MKRDPNPILPQAQVALQQLESLRFGSLLITVHDGRIVQIERTEKLRLPQSTPSTPTSPEAA